MIHIDNSVWKLICDAPNDFTVKIFLYIALNQPDEGIFGFQISKEQLQVNLNSSKTSIFSSIKWLKNNMLIQELKQVDECDFMCNPRFVMNNSDFQARNDEWNRRCRLDIQRELRLRQDRRVRQFRKEKKLKR